MPEMPTVDVSSGAQNAFVQDWLCAYMKAHAMANTPDDWRAYESVIEMVQETFGAGSGQHEPYYRVTDADTGRDIVRVGGAPFTLDKIGERIAELGHGHGFSVSVSRLFDNAPNRKGR